MKVRAIDIGRLPVSLPRLHLPLGAWISVARERARLGALSDEALADLGIDPEAARAEAARPFWDLPRRPR